MKSVNFEVNRNDLRQSRVETVPIDAAAAVASGKAVLALDHFALTANNITYAAFGDQMSYWDFFPAAEGFGRIPVWGFADVVASGVEGLAVGERIYGYFPMSSHLVVEPGRLTPRRFIDVSEHRKALPAVYNSYERVAADPAYSRTGESVQMILKPLVVTSFLIADFLDDNGFFGARQVLVSSASSKTSLGLAFCLKRLAAAGVTVIGLTSPANRAFVETVGYFDRVVTYDAIDGLDPAVPSVYVDMAGSAAVLTKVHQHFGERLTYSCRVGGTHWEGLAKRMDLPGARPKFFFAPEQIAKRHGDWGPGGLEQRFAGVWDELTGSVEDWLAIEDHHGPAAIKAAYHDMLEGRVSPATGLIMSLKS
ncbi:DUF2855 family protein [Phreatobacter stygius]|uniref:DUF2855 family protein n=1 Tax=Phreatobacter stygius TaxID=1940610 RepID=A0A4D7BJ63_9HYPH|nr:DUF2855 family protein [Phreatobacter stygius]